MNKQELINKLNKILTSTTPEIEGSDFDIAYNYAIKRAILLAEGLDEPVRPPEPKPLELEKPVVPQFVADWYEERKDYFDFNIYGFYKYFYSQGKHEEVKKWLDNAENKAIETLVKMKLYGYEVEKEKLYTVEIPNPNEPDSGHIVLSKDEHNKVYIDRHYEDDWKLLKSLKLTESEIKQDFDWAWEFAEEVEE